jgi:ATP-dependent RNA helicase RhlE
MYFSDLRLSPPILRAVEQEGYSTPTPIQEQAIPHVLAGRDVLGCAQTGTGKTAAFALPILHRLSIAPVDKARRGPQPPRALVLSPTRELAAQIGQSFAAYGSETSLAHTVIYGGVSQLHQERALARGADIVVATPGRLIDLMEQRLVDLSNIQILVLDEADRMLDMGFIHPIRRIAAATPAASRQTLLFSATMPKPIVQLAQALLRDPVRVAVSPVSSAAPAIEQAVYMVGRAAKQSLLEHLLNDGQITRAVVFTRTKHGADRVGRRLARAGILSETIHGDKAQNQRRRALDRFKAGRARILVATDVAARGLDVDDITHVFNFDLPVEPEAYIHRIGRTGRAGATGIAISFCDSQEREQLRDIERLLGSRIDPRAVPALVVSAPDVPRPAVSAASAPGQHFPQRHTRQNRSTHHWRKPTRRRAAR